VRETAGELDKRELTASIEVRGDVDLLAFCDRFMSADHHYDPLEPIFAKIHAGNTPGAVEKNGCMNFFGRGYGERRVHFYPKGGIGDPEFPLALVEHGYLL